MVRSLRNSDSIFGMRFVQTKEENGLGKQLEVRVRKRSILTLRPENFNNFHNSHRVTRNCYEHVHYTKFDCRKKSKSNIGILFKVREQEFWKLSQKLPLQNFRSLHRDTVFRKLKTTRFLIKNVYY